MNAVETADLKKSFSLKGGLFSRPAREIIAVEGITLTVPEGQAVAFVGPNGAGKSTTIKMLTGILKPSSGMARVLGYDPWRERQKLVKEIGAVFGQRSQLWLHLPPQDTFDLLAKIYDLGKHDYKVRRNLLVERFELGDFIDTPVRKLSLGQRMRCEIAASLLHRPRLLLLDEPTIGIDVVARQRLRELICQWNKEEGLTVFLTSHDTGDIASVASRMVLINHGRIVLDDTVASVSQTVLHEGLEGDLEQVIAHLFAQPATTSAVSGG